VKRRNTSNGGKATEKTIERKRGGEQDAWGRQFCSQERRDLQPPRRGGAININTLRHRATDTKKLLTQPLKLTERKEEPEAYRKT